MAKQQKKATLSKPSEIGFSFDKFIPEKFKTPLLLVLLLAMIFIFYYPIMFGSKTSGSGDLIQVKSLRQYTNASEGVTLWNPYIFCGMPAVVTSMSLRWYDLTASAYSFITKVYSSPFSDYNAIYTFSFVLMAFSSFFFMRRFGAGRGISFIVAASTIFSTGILLLFQIGHITKLMSLAIFPFLLLMIFKFQKEIKILDVLLFLLGMHVLVLGAHVQIVFYFALLVGLYFLYFIIYSLVKKDSVLTRQLLKSLVIVSVVGVIALLMSYDTYSQIYEYKPYSTRGTKSVVASNGASNQNSYEYNTMWSFPTSDLPTLLIPSFNGFGKSTYNGELTQNQDYEISTYFGEMTSVDVPMYMGIIVLFLAMYAIVVKRNEPLIQFLALVLILFLILSFGKYFPLLFNVLYYTLPFFDNFRVPSMILHLVQLIVPVLAGFGLMHLISLSEKKSESTVKYFKIASIVFSALFVVSLLFGTMLSNWFAARVNTYASSLSDQQMGQYFSAFAKYLSEMFRGDVQIAMALLAISGGIIYAYITNRLNKQIFIAAFAILIIFDLVRVGSRMSNYADAEQMKTVFEEPQYVSLIKQQNNKEPFRVVNLKQQGMGNLGQNSNFNVYFLLEDFYGYSAAKPRSYQDIMEVVGPVNVTLWKMLGVKYVVTDRPYGVDGFTALSQTKQEVVYKNERALPRIYFVDKVEKKTGKEILETIKTDSFEPKKLAFVETMDFNLSETDSNAVVNIKDYKDERISAEINSAKNGFLFFGTTYLPGWKAYIDNAPVKVQKTNYGFQGIVTPAGKHNIEFVYEPSGFASGKYISLLLNILLFGGIAVTVFISKRKGVHK